MTYQFNIEDDVDNIEVEVHFVVPFAAKDDPGSGNPATVCLVGDQPISHKTMSEFARFLNQSETIFAKRRGFRTWETRNYTPGGDRIIPGGNGTVALAWLLLVDPQYAEPDARPDADLGAVDVLPTIALNCEHSWLDASAQLIDDGLVSVSLPSVMPKLLPDEHRFEIQMALDQRFISAYRGERDAILVYDSEQEVRALKPNFDRLMQACLNEDLPYFAFIATAPAPDPAPFAPVGFVYRTFVIGQGRDRFECPGSVAALMNLPALWQTLRFTDDVMLHAEQVSERGGEAWCQLEKDRVILTAACERYCGPSTFSFPIMGGEGDCQPDQCTDPFIWI